MKKKWMMIALIALLVYMAAWTIAGQEEKDTQDETVAPQSTEQKMDAKSFMKQFAEAAISQDQVKMEKLVSKAGPNMVFNIVISIVDYGIQNIAEMKNGANFFRAAEPMAATYAKVFKKESFIEILNNYKQYTPEMCKEKLRGNILIREGTIFYQKHQWNKTLDKWNDALQVFKKIGDLIGIAQSSNNIGIVYDLLGQFDQALQYHQESLEIVRKIGDMNGEVKSLNNIGVIYLSLGQYDKALIYHQQALGLSHVISELATETTSLNNIGNVYINLGQYDQARHYYQQSLEIARKIGDVAREAQSQSLGSIGNVYINLGQYDQARQYYQQSLEIARKIGDVAGEAKSLNNMGNACYRIGQYDQALQYYQHSLEVARKIGDVVGEAQSLGNIGLVYERLGQYHHALQYFQQSLEIMHKINYLAGEAKSLNNMGNACYRIGQYDQALQYYQHSLEVARKIGDVVGEAQSLGNIGLVYDRFNQYDQALQYHQKSLEIMHKLKNIIDETNSLGNIGLVYYHISRYDQALQYFQQSLEIKYKIKDIAGEAQSLGNIGCVYYHLSQYDKSIQSFQESIKISEKIGDFEIVWRSYRGLGESFWKSGKGEEAITHYQKAIKIIEELYTNTQSLKEEERSSMIGGKQFVYQEFIELLLELHRKNPGKGYDKQAFLIAERAKSRTFQELMAKAGAKTVFSGDDVFKKMIEKEQQLIRELTNLRSLLTQEFSKPEKPQNAETPKTQLEQSQSKQPKNEEVIKSLQDQIAKTEKSLQEHQKEIDAQYPRYADLKRPKPLSVEELQEILKADETVLSYALGLDKAVVFLISKKGFKLVELETNPEELTQRIKEFRHGLENVHEMKDLEEFKPETAYILYQKLMAPLVTDLKGITKLYIAADNMLYTLPFEALVDQEMDKEKFRESRQQGKKGNKAYLGEYATLHYLVDTYTITYLPSASMLRSLRKYEKPGYGKWSKPLIAFADPIFSAQDEKSGTTKSIESKGISAETELSLQILTRSTGGDEKTLPRLKESAEEAQAIGKEVKAKPEDMYMRDKATEENIYQAKLKEARYLLFSTHGLLGGDFSGVAEPALALTLINNPEGRDGFLTMSEVLGLDLNAELIILSACNTSGQGDKAGAGEGFVGLTRSFMYSGTRAILVTHWSVESQASRDLMVESFKAMQKATRPEALRQSKLKMKNSTRDNKDVPGAKLSLAHPFFWAPFVLVGEGE